METDIIDAIVALLKGAPQTDAGNNVFPMRYKMSTLEDLPLIAVYDASMLAENVPSGHSEKRTAVIEIFLSAYGPQSPATRAEAADTKIHSLREAVEAKLGKAYDDLGVDGIADKRYLGYQVTPHPDSKDSEYLVLGCAMRYEFSYFNVLPDV